RRRRLSRPSMRWTRRRSAASPGACWQARWALLRSAPWAGLRTTRRWRQDFGAEPAASCPGAVGGRPLLLERFGGLGGRLPVLHGRRILLRQPRYGDYEAWSRLRADSRAFLEPWEPPWPADALDRGAFRRRVRRAVSDVRAGV